MKKTLAISTVLLAGAMLFTGCNSKRYDFDLDEYVTLPDYKSLEVSQADIDAEYEEELQSIIEDYTTTEEITDRAVQDGDTVTITYTFTYDEEVIKSEEGIDVVVGEEEVVEGFDEHLVGKELNNSVEYTLTLPEDYAETDYAGKDVAVNVGITGISSEVVPEINDEFVKENYSDEYANLEEFEAGYKKDITENLLWNELIDSSTFAKYPEKYIKTYYNKYVNYYTSSYQSMADMYGMELSSVLSMYGMSAESIYNQSASIAISQVKNELVTMSIVRKENIEISDEEYSAKIAELLEEYSGQYESEKELTKAVSEDEIKMNIYNDKVVELIFENKVVK